MDKVNAGDLAARERTDEQIIDLARQHGTAYVNRHVPGNASYGFMQEGILAFARALATPVATPPANTLGVALADSDWVNVVNAPSVLDPMKDKEEAVREAVKLTEARLKALNALATTATGEPTPPPLGFKFPYHATFQAIAAATKTEGGGIGVSVKAFEAEFNRIRALEAGATGEPTDAAIGAAKADTGASDER